MDWLGPHAMHSAQYTSQVTSRIMAKRILNCCHSVMVKDYRILKIIFTIWALLLIGDTFYSLLVRKPTYTSVERRPLTSTDFPEIFICPEPSVDIDALQSRGYSGHPRGSRQK